MCDVPYLSALVRTDITAACVSECSSCVISQTLKPNTHTRINPHSLTPSDIRQFLSYKMCHETRRLHLFSLFCVLANGKYCPTRTDMRTHTQTDTHTSDLLIHTYSSRHTRPHAKRAVHTSGFRHRRLRDLRVCTCACV